MRIRRMGAMVLAATLVVAAVSPVLAGDVIPRLRAPDGQTAVRGGDLVTVEGTAPASDAVQQALLRAVDRSGATLGAYDVSHRVANDDGALTGSFTLGCAYIPGCLDGDAAQRDAVVGYRLDVDTTTGSGTSPLLDFDEEAPRILGYAVTALDEVLVTFSEDVFDPEGDQAADWLVDGRSRVVEVLQPSPDTRVLRLTSPLDGPDDTPEIRYYPVPSPASLLPNEPYVDTARNTLRGEGRFALAADRIPPPIPAIAAIGGTATDDESPVLGNDATPIVTLSEVPEGATAELYLDDGDGRLEADRDLLVGEAPGSSEGAEIAWPDGLALPDGTHRLFARSRDAAACDPNAPAEGECPNPSGRTEAGYDLDTVAPRPDGRGIATGSELVVRFTEGLVGENGEPGDWSITAPDGAAGPDVTSVAGDGDVRVLEVEGVVEGSTLTYAPSDDAHADRHGNEVAPFELGIDVVAIPVLTLSDAGAVEGSGDPLVFELRLSHPVPDGRTATIELELRAGSATLGEDVEAPADTTVTIPSGSAGATFAVVVADDPIDEPDETVTLVVTDADGVEVAGGTATGTIVDDDAPSALSVGDVSLTEGLPAEVTVTLDRPSGRLVTVDWTTTDDSASTGRDYLGRSGTLTFEPGDTSASVSVPTLDDVLDEDDETFEVTLGVPEHAVVERGTGTVTLLDDDATPTVRVSDLVVQEGDEDRSGDLRVTLSAVSGRDALVVWTTREGTASADVDYRSDRGELLIPAGAASGDVEVTVLGDTVVEETETFEVAIVDVANVTVADDAGTVTILDGDGESPELQDVLPDDPSDDPSEDPSDDPSEPGEDPSQDPSVPDPSGVLGELPGGDEPGDGPSDDPSEDPSVPDPSGVLDELPGGDEPGDDPSDEPSPPSPPSDELPDPQQLLGSLADELPDDGADEPGDPSEEPDDPSDGPSLPGSDDLPDPRDDPSDDPSDEPSDDPSDGDDPDRALDEPVRVLDEQLGDDPDDDADDDADGPGEGAPDDDPSVGRDDDDALAAPSGGADLPRTGGGLAGLALLGLLGGALLWRRRG